MPSPVRRLLLAFVALLPTVVGLGAAPASSGGPIQPDQFTDHVKFLASDDLRGRGNGTPGLDRAADYIVNHFRTIGLEPGGDGGAWFQPFELVTGLKVGSANALTISGPGATEDLALSKQYYPLASLSTDNLSMPEIALDHVPVVFAGYGIVATPLAYDDYAGVDVAGKAVLVFSHEPQENDAASKFNGRSPTEYSSLLSKAMAARTKGARVLLVIQDPTHAKDEAAYESWIKDPQADELGVPVLRVERDRVRRALGGIDLDAVARDIDKDLAPRSRELTGVSVTYTEALQKDRRTVKNVVGILRGSDPARADEAIVVGAHYDHLGLGGRHSLSPQLTGQIHHGADDNASGTAAMLEIARAAASHRSEFPRTVVFVAFAGEELGLLGSTHYAESPALPLDRTVAMVNLDMVGRPRGRIMVSGLETAPVYQKVVDEASTGMTIQVKAFQEGTGVGSSDDTTFLLKKIPAIGFFSGFHEDYHRPTDTSEKIEPEGGAQVANLAYGVARRLANRTDRPEFVVAQAKPDHASAVMSSGGGYGPYFGSVPDFGESAEGVKFAEVRDGSPAAVAGLRRGDILVSFDRQPIKTLYDFTFALRSKQPGDVVEVTALRGDEKVTVKVTLTQRP